MLYADTVGPGFFRIYVYHANGGTTLRKFPELIADQDDLMRMLVDEIADLPDLTLGNKAASVKQDNIGGQGLHFMQYMA